MRAAYTLPSYAARALMEKPSGVAAVAIPPEELPADDPPTTSTLPKKLLRGIATGIGAGTIDPAATGCPAHL